MRSLRVPLFVTAVMLAAGELTVAPAQVVDNFTVNTAPAPQPDPKNPGFTQFTWNVTLPANAVNGLASFHVVGPIVPAGTTFKAIGYSVPNNNQIFNPPTETADPVAGTETYEWQSPTNGGTGQYSFILDVSGNVKEIAPTSVSIDYIDNNPVVGHRTYETQPPPAFPNDGNTAMAPDVMALPEPGPLMLVTVGSVVIACRWGLRRERKGQEPAAVLKSKRAESSRVTS